MGGEIGHKGGGWTWMGRVLVQNSTLHLVYVSLRNLVDMRYRLLFRDSE